MVVGAFDYLEGSHAPSLPGRETTVSTLVTGPAGAVLLRRRTEDGPWRLPTAKVDKDETVAQAAVRACREATGLKVTVVGIVGVFSDPRHADTDASQPVDICIRAVPAGGQLTATNNTSIVVWVPPGRLADHDIDSAARLRIEHGSSDDGPYLD